MKSKMYVAIALVATAVLCSACANTIRGAGRDVANSVDATQHAGKRISHAAE